MSDCGQFISPLIYPVDNIQWIIYPLSGFHSIVRFIFNPFVSIHRPYGDWQWNWIHNRIEFKIGCAFERKILSKLPLPLYLCDHEFSEQSICSPDGFSLDIHTIGYHVHEILTHHLTPTDTVDCHRLTHHRLPPLKPLPSIIFGLHRAASSRRPTQVTKIFGVSPPAVFYAPRTSRRCPINPENLLLENFRFKFAVFLCGSWWIPLWKLVDSFVKACGFFCWSLWIPDVDPLVFKFRPYGNRNRIVTKKNHQKWICKINQNNQLKWSLSCSEMVSQTLKWSHALKLSKALKWSHVLKWSQALE